VINDEKSLDKASKLIHASIYLLILPFIAVYTSFLS